MAITFGRVPMYGYVDRFINEKREGFGWDNLGKRTPKFIVLHRMVGTLSGTDSYFRNPAISSYTDFGLAIAASDPSIPGFIYKWNDPLGYRTPWASGPVSAPYGDGLKVVQKYGVNAANKYGISLEGGGTDEPYDTFSWNEMVHFCAWWIDFMKIPYTALPLNPHEGFNVLIWHEEFTIGTGKRCPFNWLKANSDRLYGDIAAFLKPYQTGVATPVEEPPVAGHTKDPEKPVENVPAPTYATPKPVKELALVDPSNKDAVDDLRIVNGVEFSFVNDLVEATQDTKRLQYAYTGAKSIGPDVKKGERFDVLWKFKADDDHYYYYTGWHSRIRADHTKRIADDPDAYRKDIADTLSGVVSNVLKKE